ncbi:MAG: metallophosphoesterase [Actinomycetota bacterium]|nr:metallophosphoesterase [Actinomycetota bacterium]
MNSLRYVHRAFPKAFLAVMTLVLTALALAPLSALAAGGTQAAGTTQVEPVQNPRINMLTYPVFGCPVIVERGESLTFTFDTTNWGTQEPVVAEDWSAMLITSNDPIPLSLPLTVEGGWSGSGGIYEVTVDIPEIVGADSEYPSSVPEDLYDLQVTCEAGRINLVDSQPHAVKVVGGFDDDLTFINLTDTQTGDILSVFNNLAESTPNWWPFAGTEEYWKHLRKAVDQINLIHPDMLIMSGDIVYGQLYFGEYPLEYPITHDILQGLDVPVFIAPGNHDNYVQAECDGEMYFQRYFAPLRYSFDYGPHFHFTAVDTYDWSDMERAGYCLIVSTWGGQITEEQLDWLGADLTANQGAEKIRVVFCHHSPDAPSEWADAWWNIHDNADYPYPQLYWRLLFGLLEDQKWVGEGRQDMLDLLELYGVDLVLAGHVHYDYINYDMNPYGTDIAVTTAGCFDLTARKAYPGYRVMKIEDGEFTTLGYMDHEGIQDFYSTPIYCNGYPPADNLKQQTEPAIAYSFAVPNDGSSDHNTLTVENRLLTGIPVYVEFVLPAGDYVVNNGVELQPRSIREDKVVLYVGSSVEGEDSASISVDPM